jgi:hypothetical protein
MTIQSKVSVIAKRNHVHVNYHLGIRVPQDGGPQPRHGYRVGGGLHAGRDLHHAWAAPPQAPGLPVCHPPLQDLLRGL